MKDNVLQHNGYYGSVECDLAAGLLFGQVLFVSDLISYEADTVGDLKAAFVAAVDEYLLDCETLGKAPNKSLTGSFNVRLGGERHKLLSVRARKDDFSVNKVLCMAIDQYFEGNRIVENHTHIHPAYEHRFTAELFEDEIPFTFKTPVNPRMRKH